MTAALSLARGLLELVAPQRCAACDGPVPWDADGFCPACFPLLEPMPLRPGRDGAVAAYAYGGPLADALRRFKYGGQSELAGPLGRLLAEVAERAFAGRVDLVVPVPLDGRRLRARGYDQAALLARPVARRLAVPLRPGRLRRVRAARPQASLRRRGRIANLAGVFQARPVRGAVLLVDDVRTTGTTLAEAATALRDAGATEVMTLVLAQATAA